MAVVDTEVLAGFPVSHDVTHELVRLDFPAPFPGDEYRVYRRKEEYDDED